MGRSGQPGESYQAVCGLRPARPELSMMPPTVSQTAKLCSSLASLAHPHEVSASFPCCSYGGGMAAGVREPVSPSSLELALFTSAWALVLSSGPSPPKMCLLLELLPLQHPVSLGVVIKGKKKKKKASAQGWVSPRSWGLAPGSSLPALPTSPRAPEQAKAFVVC